MITLIDRDRSSQQLQGIPGANVADITPTDHLNDQLEVMAEWITLYGELS